MGRNVSNDPQYLASSFGTLVGSSGLSNLADGIFKVALPLLAIRYTRSPALVAGLELVRTLPWLVLSLPAGALIDRLDRRRSMVWANAARALLTAIPAIAIAADEGTIWLLYLAAAGTGVAEVFYDTSAQSILPSVVPRTRLDRANGYLFAVEVGAQQFAGPPIAGVLAGVAVVLAFATPSILWATALLVLLALRGQFRPLRTGSPTSIRSDIRQGISYLLHHPVLRVMALMVGMTNLATNAVWAVLVLYAVGTGSELGLTEPQFGLLLTALAVGGLGGSLVAERVQRRVGRARALTLSVVGMASYIWVFVLTTNPWIIAVVMVVSAATNMLWNITTVSFRQRVTPQHLLGRVNSAYRLVAWGTMPVGALLGGALGQWLGVRSVFVAMGLLSLAVLIPNRLITESALSQAEEG